MDVEAAVAQGRIRGRLVDGVRSFLGVPYAAAPYGSNRFQAPQPPLAWSQVRNCTAYGPTVLKPRQPDVFEELLPDPVIPGEDCLTVNIWTPEGASRLPVLVWVHGGGYMTGSGAVPIYDGTSFARHGVVCVTINYRLGVDGFAVLPDRPANRGLLDMVAALRWVRDNIAALGGDPTRVTIAGQSAGAMAVTTLLSMPLAQGLFARVIAQSGGGHHALPRSAAERVSSALCADLGIDLDADALAAVPADKLLAAVDALTARIPADPDPGWDEVRQRVLAFQPVIDGEILPALPVDGVAAGVGENVDLLTGTNSDEYTLWSVPTGLAVTIDDAALHALFSSFGVESGAGAAAYRAQRAGASAADLYADVMTDWAFWIPMLRVAEGRAGGSGRTFCYEFAWPSPLYEGRLGATHALEVAFSFDNLAVDWARPMRGADAPQQLADELHGALLGFIRTGEPGWNPYGPAREVRVFGGAQNVLLDPHRERRVVWSGVR